MVTQVGVEVRLGVVDIEVEVGMAGEVVEAVDGTPIPGVVAHPGLAPSAVSVETCWAQDASVTSNIQRKTWPTSEISSKMTNNRNRAINQLAKSKMIRIRVNLIFRPPWEL